MSFAYLNEFKWKINAKTSFNLKYVVFILCWYIIFYCRKCAAEFIYVFFSDHFLSKLNEVWQAWLEFKCVSIDKESPSIINLFMYLPIKMVSCFIYKGRDNAKLLNKLVSSEIIFSTTYYCCNFISPFFIWRTTIINEIKIDFFPHWNVIECKTLLLCKSP